MSQQLLKRTGPLAWAALFALLIVLAGQVMLERATAQAALRPRWRPRFGFTFMPLLRA